MKKLIAVLLMITMISLVGCSSKKHQYVDVYGIVIDCSQGAFRFNQVYYSMANAALCNKDYAQYSTFYSLAVANGYYEYRITVQIGEITVYVTRNSPYQFGDVIAVTQVKTFTEDNQLISIEYR